MGLCDKIMSCLETEGVSDHGMLDYLLDLWKKMAVSYKLRLELLHEMSSFYDASEFTDSEN
jgi:hypothetical protein